MVNKAYIILAHKDPVQLARLIDSLSGAGAEFYIHIDKKVDMTGFMQALEAKPGVHFLCRVKSLWASYAIVEAALLGMQALTRSGKIYDQVFLLSGQDYPIRSHPEIDGWCLQNFHKIHIEHYRLPAHDKWQPNGGLYRVDKYYVGQRMHQKLMSKSLNLLSRYFPFLERKLYRGMMPYAGSAWWCLSHYAVEYILRFIYEHPGYAAFHKYTFAPDEVFFQTILLNSADPRIQSNIVNSDARFISWSNIHASHPQTITPANLPEMMASKALFARKFDSDDSADVLDQIDRLRTAALTDEIANHQPV